MALNKEKASYITKNIAELINTQDISLLHDASELLRVLKNKGDQRFVDIVNNIESKLNNNQTWTLAKQFPSVAEQGLQALRDWSAKADMQRERMAILQYYAEERENRDAREARNATLARNVVGGMGVSLGNANSFNSFNSFGSGLYFDNNINTLMVRLSFLDREMRLDDFKLDMAFDEKGEFRGNSIEAKAAFEAVVYNGSFGASDTEKAQKLINTFSKVDGVDFKIGKNSKGENVVGASGVEPASVANGVSQITVLDQSPVPQQNVENAKTHNANVLIATNKFTEENLYNLSNEDLGKLYLSINRSSKENLDFNNDFVKSQLALVMQDLEKDNYKKSIVAKIASHISVNNAGASKGNHLLAGEKDNPTVLLNGNKTYYDIETHDYKDDEKKAIEKFANMPYEERLKLYKANGLNPVAQEIQEYEIIKIYGLEECITALMKNGMSKKAAEEHVNQITKIKKEWEAEVDGDAPKESNENDNKKSNISKASKASQPEPIQELAPENKGKPDSQVSLVSAIATPKLTPTYKQEKTEQEKDEERRKREEKDVLDRVEPNRTADHSPRALNEKNTTASIEEQKIILAQQERNMTQEEKMRMEQENAQRNQNNKSGMDV
ncbi:hypothetical protein [Ursidibacter sp. B-7004-1]